MRVVTAALAGVVVAVAVATRAAAAPPPPNIVVILADDLGWGDVLNGGPALTPHLDAFRDAPSTVHFPRFVIGGSVCSPTRATILTGRTNTRDCITYVEQTALPLQLQGITLADYAKSAGAVTGFFGKWHLSSMTDSLAGGSCYAKAATNGTCLPGYVAPKASPALCCDGRDAQLPPHNPLAFGFDTVFATSQVAPTSTSNCGCTQTVPGAGIGCNLGHYAGAGHMPDWMPGLECDQTYYTVKPGQPLQPYPVVTDTDDADMLVQRWEAFASDAIARGLPFVSQISFHNVHIPFVAPPEFRSLYPNATFVEQDYWGAISAMDAAIGRVRGFLRDMNVSE